MEFEYVPQPLELDAADSAFAEVFAAFQRSGGDDPDQPPADAAAAASAEEPAPEAEAEEEPQGLSRRKQRLASRMSVAELKQHCRRPEVVEVWDTTAADPLLLVYLKAYRNTVPVPRHWSQKRKFLQGKRGVEKPPWELPDFLAATGIGKLREAYAEKEAAKSLKGKAHERMAPKMGRIDIDYQLLHDAFFKHQTKPKLSGMGELYFEGKEFEVDLGTRRPGRLTAELTAALGMPPGAPPPWLVNMQRHGPPPSYPALRIPGLNAPIPPGCSFGYHAGGWGKPPVDETGAPLYGDVFGVAPASQPSGATILDLPVDKTRRWGELEEAPAEESGSEDGSDADAEEAAEEAEALPAAAEAAEELLAGISSTVSSLATGVATPADLMLRKGEAAPRPPLFRVLEQAEAHVGAGSIMGASHTYVLPPADGTAARKAAQAAGVVGGGGVALTLAPEELGGLDDATLAKRYEAAQAAQAAGGRGDDFSDLVAEQAAKAKRKADGKRKDDAKRFKF